MGEYINLAFTSLDALYRDSVYQKEKQAWRSTW